MAHIKKYSHSKHIKSTTEYAALWHLMFDNAREFNVEGSVVYQDADFLQGVLDKTLDELAAVHSVAGVIPHQCEFHFPELRQNLTSCTPAQQIPLESN